MMHDYVKNLLRQKPDPDLQEAFNIVMARVFADHIVHGTETDMETIARKIREECAKIKAR